MEICERLIFYSFLAAKIAQTQSLFPNSWRIIIPNAEQFSFICTFNTFPENFILRSSAAVGKYSSVLTCTEKWQYRIELEEGLKRLTQTGSTCKAQIWAFTRSVFAKACPSESTVEEIWPYFKMLHFHLINPDDDWAYWAIMCLLRSGLSPILNSATCLG